MLLIKNGRVIDPASGTDAKRDIWIDGTRIARIAPAEDTGDSRVSPNGETLDATGLIVAPGFIDLHCHLREPGGESSETIEQEPVQRRAGASPQYARCRTRGQ
jgi:dihydroorotase